MRRIVPVASAVSLLYPTLCWAAQGSSENSIIGEIAIAAFLVNAALGVFLGLTQRAVVFRNYDDLALVFGCSVSIVLAVSFTDTRILFALTVLLSLGLFLAVTVRTWQDNGLLLLPVVLFTKLPLSILWITQVIQAVNPTGKTYMERSRNRGSALLILAILTPLLARLIRDHEGFLSERKRTSESLAQ